MFISNEGDFVEQLVQLHVIPLIVLLSKVHVVFLCAVPGYATFLLCHHLDLFIYLFVHKKDLLIIWQ